MSGWIQLHRKLLDNPIFKNHKLLQTFLYCLLRASHKEYDILIGEAIVHLKKGELATGRKAISAATGLTEQNVRTSLSKLETLSILTINPTTKYSIISISNWDSYQQTNQQVTNSQPTSNQQVTTNNNVNKGNNEKNKIPFDFFWDIYPKKVDKKKSELKWKSMKIDEITFNKIKSHLKVAYAQTEKKFIIGPLVYLNGERWNDEIITATTGSFNQQHQENKPGRAFGE